MIFSIDSRACDHSPQSLTQHVTVHVFHCALAIGKMADEKEFDEKAADSDSEEEEDEDEEEISNGKDGVEEDESEFDDPEGFVDDITDEGKILNIQHVCRSLGKADHLFRLVWIIYSSVQPRW